MDVVGEEFEFCTDCGISLSDKSVYVCGDVAVLCKNCLIALRKRTEHREQNERLSGEYDCKCIECVFG